MKNFKNRQAEHRYIMRRRSKTQKQKSKSGIGSIIRHYVFLWPSLRTYYTLFAGYFSKDKNKKKEKIIIID